MYISIKLIYTPKNHIALQKMVQLGNYFPFGCTRPIFRGKLAGGFRVYLDCILCGSLSSV